ncbi:hypothetical protein [Polyangium spumosum]|uniref:hypothetical protein n=1 Tax=Polyangium spumosum TaxID=889282 RepID=UPI0014782787|nr:hypothetical protein [Polyangium spumosum]
MRSKSTRAYSCPASIGPTSDSGGASMTAEEKRARRLFSEFVKASNAVLLRSFDRNKTYVEIVDEYRAIEAEFVARMGDDEPGALETRRHVAESIFSLARRSGPTFEVCREAWNDLVRIGFTGSLTKCMYSLMYADFCAFDEQPEEGLAVLEPLRAELEGWIERSRAAQRPTMFYEDQLETSRRLQDELEARRRGERSPKRVTRAMVEGYDFGPEGEEINQVSEAIWETRRAVYRAFARSRGRCFAEIADDYRQVEADVVARARACDGYKPLVPKVRRYIVQDGLRAACGSEQPFEVCRDAWNEAVRRGFSDFEAQCRMTRMYAESCGFNQKPEEGLAVLEPLLVDLEQGLKAKELTRKRWLKVRAKRRPPMHEEEPPPSFYRTWLESLRELRDKLDAQPKAGAAPR